MSLQYIRDFYKVPARRGGKITYTGNGPDNPIEGVIVGARSAYLRVRFNGMRLPVFNLHPTWMVKYAESGKAGGG